MTVERSHLGHALRESRMQAGIDQAVMADTLGLSLAFVKHAELRYRPARVSLTVLVQWAHAAKCDPQDLVLAALCDAVEAVSADRAEPAE